MCTYMSPRLARRPTASRRRGAHRGPGEKMIILLLLLIIIKIIVTIAKETYTCKISTLDLWVKTSCQRGALVEVLSYCII